MTRPSPVRALLFALALTLPAPLAAQPLELAFLPPAVEPQGLCSATEDDPESDLGLGTGEDPDEARLFLRFLRRDIRTLSAEVRPLVRFHPDADHLAGPA